jgi:hypothetical protein
MPLWRREHGLAIQAQGARECRLGDGGCGGLGNWTRASPSWTRFVRRPRKRTGESGWPWSFLREREAKWRLGDLGGAIAQASASWFGPAAEPTWRCEWRGNGEGAIQRGDAGEAAGEERLRREGVVGKVLGTRPSEPSDWLASRVSASETQRTPGSAAGCNRPVAFRRRKPLRWRETTGAERDFARGDS